VSTADVLFFPGGAYDGQQDSSMKMCAIRECFEETGVLYTCSKRPQRSTLESARHEVHAGRSKFAQFLLDHSMMANEDGLLPFTTWITPKSMPKRFDNKFYLAFLDEEHSTGHFSSPSSDGQAETVSADFIHPRDALLSFQRKEILLYPPQFYLISAINNCIQHANPKINLQMYSQMEGEAIFDPEPVGKASDGRSILALDGDEARDGVIGSRNRMLLMTCKGAPQSIELIQNVIPISKL